MEKYSYLTNDKFYTAKYDIVFKAIIIDDDKHQLMEAILSEVLGNKVKFIKYLKNEIAPKDAKEREKRLDALIEADGKIIHLELNYSYSKSTRYRNFIYFEAFHSNKTRKNNDYLDNTEYCHIDLTFGIKNSRKPIKIYEMKHTDDDLLITNYKYYEVNMDFIKSFWYDKKRKEINRYKYLLMLDLPANDLKEYAQAGDYLVKDYRKKVMELNDDFSFRNFISPEDDERMLREAEAKEFREEALAEGIAEGKAKGIKEANKKMAIKMLNNKEPIEKIIEYTGLTKEEIATLK